VYPLGVAVFTQNMVVQRVTASVLFIGEQRSAVLALVALDVEAAVESDYAHRLFPGRPRHDGVSADGALRGESLVEVFDAVDLIRRVHRKWHSVQRLVTHNARKTLRMVRLSGGPQYPIEDRSEALAALLQRV